MNNSTTTKAGGTRSTESACVEGLGANHLQSTRVLLIEDDPGDVRLLRAMLVEANSHCFDVQCASNLSGGKRQLETDRFDVVLLDLSLPDDQGLAALSTILAAAPHVALIVLAGPKDEHLAVRAVEAGAQDYLIKGKIDADLLIRSIRHGIALTRLEKQVQAHQTTFTTIVDKSPHGILIVRPDGQIRFANTAACHLFNRPVEGLVGEMFGLPLVPGEKIEVELVRSRAGPGIAELRVIHADWAGQPAYLALLHDITERRRAEEELIKRDEQLRQSQKLESIGRLAGGVAHDFNNMLSVILGYSEMLEASLGDTHPCLVQQVRKIRDAGGRATSLIQQLLAFSRKEDIQPQVLDINKIIADLCKMLLCLIGENIEVVPILDPSLERTKVDPVQIEQVIINLAVNARDAMPNGGKLFIETANVDLDDSVCEKHGVPVTSGPYIMLAVSDTGCGMDETTQKLIFEPFFTTKERGKGTGLGLSTVYGIVKQSGGYIWVYSEPGIGTSFKVYFPRSDRLEETHQPAQAPTPSPKGTETVLLVEDEQSVRELAELILLENGYNVLQAANGKEALEILEPHDGTVHLLITDVVMPGMNGRELAEAVLALRPESKVLYMSGYTDDAIIHHGVLDQRTAFLEKPFTSKSLLQKVRDVLGTPA